MCLTMKEGVGLTFVNGEATCYKVYLKMGSGSSKALNSVHMSGNYRKAGVIQSTRKVKEITQEEQETKEIHYGIHVFLNKEDAEKHVGLISYNENYRVVPVKVKVEDIVALGVFYHSFNSIGGSYNNAVFTKIEITQEAWDEAVKD